VAKPSNATKERGTYGNVVFITYDLPKEHKANCKAWLPTLEEFDDALLKFESAGYKVSTKWDDRNECFACFVTPPPADKETKGMLLTGRGSTPLKAVKNAMYQHYHIFETNWSNWYVYNSNEVIDD